VHDGCGCEGMSGMGGVHWKLVKFLAGEGGRKAGSRERGVVER
jgi:hypothetical protein